MTEASDMEYGLTKDERTWGMLCHLSALCAFTGIPFAGIIAPLIIWLIKKEESPFVDYNGKESLNFQISMAIYTFISIILILAVVGIFLLILVGFVDLILVIVAGVKANSGEHYRYPFTIRFIH